MDVNFINPFLESIMNVVETMAQMKAEPQKPFKKEDNISRGDISGIIGMAGEQTKGSLAISFPEKTIVDITSKILMEKMSQLDETVVDMVGEITNVITGGAKKILSERGYKFEMAIPTMVIGKNHCIRHKTTGPIIVIPFETKAGPFFAEVCFKEFPLMRS